MVASTISLLTFVVLFVSGKQDESSLCGSNTFCKHVQNSRHSKMIDL